MGSEGIKEILKEFRKRNKDNEEEGTDLSVEKIEAKEIKVNREKSTQQKIQIVMPENQNPFSLASKESYSRNYITAKPPEAYTQSIKMSRLSQLQSEKIENRQILKVNGLSIVIGSLDPSTNKYDVKEIELNKEEEKIISNYEMLHKLTEHINMKGPLTHVYDSIKKEIDEFLVEQNENHGLARTEVISYHLLKKYGYYELTPLLMDNQIEDINGIEGTNIVVHDSKYP